eukprot:jgi/Mesvir1/18819/Mv04310-RA.1
MPRPKKKRALLDDEDEEAADFGFNESFAKRFEYNKRRQELEKVRQLEKAGELDSSTSEEEDEGDLLTTDKELRILETLSKIRNKDPSIYQDGVNFFPEESDADEDDEGDEHGGVGGAKEGGKARPMYLKDVNARHALEDAEGGGEGDEEGGRARRRAGQQARVYDREQDELRKSFLRSVEEQEASAADEGSEGLLRIRKKSKAEREREAREGEEATATVQARKKEEEVNRRLEEFFGHDAEVDEASRFLKNYIANKGWIDPNANQGVPHYNEIVEESEEELDKVDDFEKSYNFRFEQEGAAQVAGHSRVIEGSVRRVESSRKRQREAKEERAKEEEVQRQALLRRVKNLKKQEILDRLEKVKQMSGAKELKLRPEDLDDDFDPAEHDRRMREAFGEDYYEAPVGDLLCEEPMCRACGHGVTCTRSRYKGQRVCDDGWGQVAQCSHADISFNPQPTRKRSKKAKKKAKLLNQKFAKELEEYYKLDYESMVAGIPCRFKYATVKPKTYGIKKEELLALDDAELNSRVSLKKLAPYVEEDPEDVHWLALKRKQRGLYKMMKKEKAGAAQGASEAAAGPSGGELSAAAKKNRKRRAKAQGEVAVPSSRKETYEQMSLGFSKKKKKKKDKEKKDKAKV